MIDDRTKTIYVVGAGGRTGMLFCRELQNAARMIGIAFPAEIENIKSGKAKIARGKNPPEIFAAELVPPEDFSFAAAKNPPDFLWLATRNPVDKITAFYYRHFANQQNFPALVLSQNGLSAAADAKKGLQEALGQDADKVAIVRVSLINGVDLNADRDGTLTVGYKLPIKLGFGRCEFAEVSPMQTYIGDTSASSSASLGLGEIFEKAGVKAREFRGKEVLAMENAKLFLNLIGMAAATAQGSGEPTAAVGNTDVGAGSPSRKTTADQGWRDKEILKKEMAMLREFVLAVNAVRGGFAGKLGGYPVKLLARLALLPVWWLAPWRGVLAGAIAKGRNRPKDLLEIDYYNGEAVRLGKKANVPTPANEAIIAKVRALKRKI